MLSIFDKIKSTLFVKRAGIVLIRHWLDVTLKNESTLKYENTKLNTHVSLDSFPSFAVKQSAHELVRTKNDDRSSNRTSEGGSTPETLVDQRRCG